MDINKKLELLRNERIRLKATMTKPRMKSKTYKDGTIIFKQGIDHQAYDVGLMYHEPTNHETAWRIELLNFAELKITNHELACLKKILNSKKVTKLLEGF